MCRFLAYSGPPTSMQELLLDSPYSLVRQSKHARMRHGPVNGDGFGVGWYPTHEDPEPGTFVSIEPAWSNRNLLQIATKIHTPLFFAHVRDATPGMPVSQANCHPFRHGPWLWMHNGFLGDFSQWRRKLLGSLSDNTFNLIQGNTDSEHVFAIFMGEVGFDPETSAAMGASELLKALNNCIKKLIQIKSDVECNAQAHMNFAVSNGRVSLFSRLSIDSGEPPPTLHYLIDEASCIVASEPLSDCSDWQEVDQGQVLVLEKESELRIEEVSL